MASLGLGLGLGSALGTSGRDHRPARRSRSLEQSRLASHSARSIRIWTMLRGEANYEAPRRRLSVIVSIYNSVVYLDSSGGREWSLGEPELLWPGQTQPCQLCRRRSDPLLPTSGVGGAASMARARGMGALGCGGVAAWLGGA